MNQLTLNEQKQFAKFLKEEAAKYITEWIPFWEREEGLQDIGFVVVGEEAKQVNEDGLKRLRLLLIERLTDVPKFARIGKVKQRDYSIFLNNIYSTLFLLAYILRRYNGEAKTNDKEIVVFMLGNCSPLRPSFKRYFGSLEEALRDSASKVRRVLGIKGQSQINLLYQDMLKIMTHKMFVLEMLFLLFDLFDINSAQNGAQAARMKVLYYISFVCHLEKDDFFLKLETMNAFLLTLEKEKTAVEEIDELVQKVSNFHLNN